MNVGKREEAAAHPLIGTTLRDTYRVVRLIDRGGMGLVFEAEHVRLKRRVAVKVLSHTLLRDHYALARFRAEAEIIALLQHPHVVQVIDFDVTARQEPYIVMELLEGETLSARLERDSALPLRFVVRVATQAASALNAVHEASIVHRDLKPSNIFLADMSDGTWVKLLDFGISKRARGGQGLTGEHAIMGTPDYMSPEQALGHAASADHRSDQYSLAVIVYEMLAGRVPFLGNSEIEILSQVISLQAPPLRDLAPAVPEPLSRVLDRAMSKLPSDRFASMDDFALALAQAGGVSTPPSLRNDGQTLRLTSDPAVLSPDSVRGSSARRTNSGLRERTPSRKAATLAGLSPRAALLGLLGRFERAYAHENVERAAELVEQALTAADTTTDAEARVALASTQPLMLEILESHLAPLSRRLQPAKAKTEAERLSPQEAFLLANAERRYSIEELVDSSPLSRLESLRLLARLLRSGVLVRAE